MLGQIKRIVQSGEFITYIILLDDNDCCVRTYTGKQYRNYAYWKDLRIGDRIGGIKWKYQEKEIVDADSPVYLLQPTLF